jgi:SAM-dependent methyltransferase
MPETAILRSYPRRSGISLSPGEEDELAAVGYIEVCSDTLVSGWAWDSAVPGRRLEIAILLDGKPLAQVTAQRHREDLKAAGIGDGGYGFSYSPAASIGPKSQERVTALVVGTQVELRHLSRGDPGLPLMAQLGPIAPELLRQRVAGTPDEKWFDRSGDVTVGEWLRALGCLNRSIEEFETIFDWGCGCGRALRHLAVRLRANQRLVGIDVDAEAIQWVKANYPQVTVFTLAETPPAPFPDGIADLIVSQSIFTHLPEQIADLWLTELARILKPGGLLITTFHGATVVDHHRPNTSFITPLLLDLLEHYGFYYHAGRSDAEAALPEYYGATLHTIDYITRRWTKFFKIRAWLPGFALSYQDTLVLEKASVAAGPSTETGEVFKDTLADRIAAPRAETLNPRPDSAEVIRKLEEIRTEFSEFRERVEKALGVGWQEIQALRPKNARRRR